MVILGEAVTQDESSQEIAFFCVIEIFLLSLVLRARFEGFTCALVTTLIVPFGVAAAIYSFYVKPRSIFTLKWDWLWS